MAATRPTVLFAEDDSIIRFAVVRTLQARGFSVEAVATVEEAQSLLHSFSYDLVLADLRFSRSDALEGLRLLDFAARLEPRPLRVLFSAHLSPEVAAAAQRSGVDRVQSKADGLIRLGDALLALLSASKGGAVASHAAA